jgi:hypothetical protein
MLQLAPFLSDGKRRKATEKTTESDGTQSVATEKRRKKRRKRDGKATETTETTKAVRRKNSPPLKGGDFRRPMWRMIQEKGKRAKTELLVGGRKRRRGARCRII